MKPEDLSQTVGKQYNETSQQIKEAASKLADNTKEMAEQAKETMKKSTSDWLEYIQKHPIQSMVYGVVIYFSIKGMLQK